jgi:hypothetical protein
VASLGNIGKTFKQGKAYMGAWTWFDFDKRPTSVTMAAISNIPYAFVVLTRNGVYQYRSRADAAGNWAFYDMDDSGSQIYSIASYTQDGATGEIWSATVTGAVVVVTKIFSNVRTVAQTFT